MMKSESFIYLWKFGWFCCTFWLYQNTNVFVYRMWREIKLLAEAKPVVASMSDVAASGGYYMAMAANTIVAENLTLTGSIGVVTGDLTFVQLSLFHPPH